jgi:hypothetical protein
MNTTLQSQTQPSVDSIQEFQVQASNYSAEYGQAGGGVFIATMKSATNTFHGTAYESNGLYTGGFGYINTATAGSQAQLAQSPAPREGLLVAHFAF